MIKKGKPYFCLLSLALVVLSTSAMAQKPDTTHSRWSITSGFGYYHPYGEAGNIFYSELGYHLSTGYIIGAGFGLGDIFNKYSNKRSLFKGIRKYDNYYLIRIFIKRPFSFGPKKNNIAKIGVGVNYIQPRFSHPEVTLVPVFDNKGNIIKRELQISQQKSTSNSIELGFPITVEYNYNFDPLAIGFRGKFFVLTTAGFGGYILSPQLSLKF